MSGQLRLQLKALSVEQEKNTLALSSDFINIYILPVPFVFPHQKYTTISMEKCLVSILIEFILLLHCMIFFCNAQTNSLSETQCKIHPLTQQFSLYTSSMMILYISIFQLTYIFQDTWDDKSQGLPHAKQASLTDLYFSQAISFGNLFVCWRQNCTMQPLLS